MICRSKKVSHAPCKGELRLGGPGCCGKGVGMRLEVRNGTNSSLNREWCLIPKPPSLAKLRAEYEHYQPRKDSGFIALS